MSLIKRLSNLFGTHRRRIKVLSKNLKAKEFTIFSNNYIGGVFTHDVGRRFNSPTVNLTLDGHSFIKFLQNPKQYVGGGNLLKKRKRVGPVLLVV